MKLMKKIQGAVHTCLLPLCVASFVFGTTAHAQDVRERVIKFSHVQPKNSHMDAGAQKFADLVAQKSNKKITVRVYPGGSLGGDIQTLSALQGGTIEMTTMPPGLMIGLSKEYGSSIYRSCSTRSKKPMSFWMAPWANPCSIKHRQVWWAWRIGTMVFVT